MPTHPEQTPEQKHERLHLLAVSLFKSKDYRSALECWSRIKKENPEFPGLSKWILKASQETISEANTKSQVHQDNRNRQKTFKTRMETAERYGNKLPHKMRFHPIRIRALPKRRIRHRHIAFIMLLIVFLVLALSILNKSRYLLLLNPENGHLVCMQGTFFPYGWEKNTHFLIGLRKGWEEDIDNPVLKKTLIRGIKIYSQNQLDAKIISLFTILGERSLEKMTIQNQMEAIYYFKRIENAGFLDKVRWQIATAFYNLAKLYIEKENDFRSAMEYTEKARDYSPTYPGIDDLQSKIRNKI